MIQHRSQSGFSLVELMVASSIFFIFMVSIFGAYTQGHHSYVRGQDRMEVQQSARIAVDAMVREIRMAGYDPSGAIGHLATVSAIQLAETNTLSVIADLDGDDVTDKISYSLEDGQVIRELASWNGTAFAPISRGELADGVTNLVFGYFDGAAPSNNSIAAPVASGDLSRIRRVSVGVIAARTSYGRREGFPLVTDIALRNLQ